MQIFRLANFAEVLPAGRKALISLLDDRIAREGGGGKDLERDGAGIDGMTGQAHVNPEPIAWLGDFGGVQLAVVLFGIKGVAESAVPINN